MSEATPEAPAQEPQPKEASQPNEPDKGEQPKPDETDWKAEARKWETRAKENNTKAEKAAEKARLEAMSESERAIAEAETRGRTAATADFGQRLAKTEFDALAGRRNPDVKTDDVLEFIDLSRFLDESGEPDKKAIASAVERLVPAPTESTPSFDGGSRSPAAAPQGMSQIIRKASGRA